MKKRLLITSIVMMLVVAVALSTATYAWFTSNANVQASSISMTAAVSDATSIGISWTNGNFGTSISAAAPAAGTKFVPAAIGGNATSGTPTTYLDTLWSSSTVFQEGGKIYFNETDFINTIDSATDSKMVAYTWQSDSGNKDFFINNGSTANTIQHLYIDVDVADESSSFIRVAVFKDADTTDGFAGTDDFKLSAIIAGQYIYTKLTEGTADGSTTYYDGNGAASTPANGASLVGLYTRTSAVLANTKVAVGTVVPKDSTHTIPVTSDDATGANPERGTDYCIDDLQVTAIGSYDLCSLAPEEVIHLRIVIWMDGTELNDNTSGTTGKVSPITIGFRAA